MSSQPAPSSQQPRPATVGTPGFVSDVAAIREHDPTTRRMLEDVLADEEEHADDMASLLKRVGSA
jgi:bacterioferritin (cytochrome b1)